jgi:NAD(P)-dependent dehydrogenase (short-subunit alcohol dehydrogenase family)
MTIRPVAVVTGAGRGIGRAIAIELAERGFDLALPLLDPASEESTATAKELRSTGANVLPVACDLADIAGHPATALAIAKRFGRLDVLVNNAGIGAVVRGDMLDLAAENFDSVMGVNLRGTLFFTQAIAREMLRLGERATARAIITITSVSAELASPERADYCMSKAALSMMVKALALRLAPENIGVFEVRPGIIRTPMTAPVASAYDKRIAEGLVPARRWGEPDDVAGVVSLLAEGRAAFATGSAIQVDGGLSIPRL